MSRPSCLLAVSVSLALVASPRTATAQTRRDAPPPVRAEWWGTVSGSVSGPAGTLMSSYSPPLLFDGDFMSAATQSVTATAGVSVGFTAGLNVFPSEHVGLQLLFDRMSYSLSGANGPYAVSLQYVSRLPPNDQPQPVDLHRSTPWPDTAGSLTQTAVAINVAVRMKPSDRIAVEIAGGPAIYRFTGDLQPIAYTAFNLGGHSVLFENTYRLGGSLGPSHAIGFDAGVGVDVAVVRHAALIVGYRYFGGFPVEIAVSPATILNSEEIGIQQSMADIASRLSLGSIRTSPGSSRVFAGFKIMR
jgi:hypothetical protein